MFRRNQRRQPPLRIAFLSAVAASLLLVALPTAARAQEVVPDAQVRNGVVVRAGPSGGAARVGSLRPGERATLLDETSSWYRVRLHNGTEGWVSRRWTDLTGEGLVPPPPPPPPPPPGGGLELHFIDVGQGDSTLVVCPNGATMLIDSGSTSDASPTVVGRYITDRIADTGGDIDYLIVSHPDQDHYNLVPRILANVPVGRAWYVGNASDYNFPGAFTWLTTAPRTSTRLTAGFFDRESTPNANIDCGAARVWILAAAVEATASPSNAKSIVVMIRMGDFEAVITGDATRDTENAILARYTPAWLDVDVLRVGHHGSLATSTQVRWADALSPTTAVFSAGRVNGYGHPRAEVTARLVPHTRAAPPHPFRDARRPPGGYVFADHPNMREAVYATASSGTVTVRTNGTGYSVETAR
jgi:beta-lactamase superfamily II metal-dependent hydrolase